MNMTDFNNEVYGLAIDELNIHDLDDVVGGMCNLLGLISSINAAVGGSAPGPAGGYPGDPCHGHVCVRI
jgi:hypothetical protein